MTYRLVSITVLLILLGTIFNQWDQLRLKVITFRFSTLSFQEQFLKERQRAISHAGVPFGILQEKLLLKELEPIEQVKIYLRYGYPEKALGLLKNYLDDKNEMTQANKDAVFLLSKILLQDLREQSDIPNSPLAKEKSELAGRLVHLSVLNPEELEWKWLHSQVIALGKNKPIDRLLKKNKLVSIPSLGYGYPSLMDNLDGENKFSIITNVSKTISETHNIPFLNLFTLVKDQIFDSSGSIRDYVLPGNNTIRCDLNNDGRIDILLLRGIWSDVWTNDPVGLQLPFTYLQNDGGGNFTDRSKDFGSETFGPARAGVCADFNNDGFLDLIIYRESNEIIGYQPLFFLGGPKDLKNASAILPTLGRVTATAALDYDNDGRQDLIITQYNGPPVLLHNEGNKNNIPKFVIKTQEAGIKSAPNDSAIFSFDIDNDANEDLIILSATPPLANPRENLRNFVSTYFGQYSFTLVPRIYLNKSGHFVDATETMNLRRSLDILSAAVGDINSDGFLDLVISNSGLDADSFSSVLLFTNKNGKVFLEDSDKLPFPSHSRTEYISLGDANSDGTPDFLITRGNSLFLEKKSPQLFLSTMATKNFVTIKLQGRTSNALGIGAKIKFHLKDKKENNYYYYRTVINLSTAGANSLIVTLNFPNDQQLETLFVNWPNGKNQFREYTVQKEKFQIISE